ncbi:MAG: spondin domain-containing protein [Miltoncostaeaceae bacterium]
MSKFGLPKGRRKRLAMAALAVPVLALGVAACGDDDDDAVEAPTEAVDYEVTITNTNAGQPLTPPLIVTHTEDAQLFSVGAEANEAIQEIAENGNLEPGLGLTGVTPVQGAETPVVPTGSPGAGMFPDTVTFTVTAQPGEGLLSWASMLICTNDGFTGVNGLALPAAGETASAMVNAYDAGTENNTEGLGDIVPPCQDLMGVTGAEGTGMSNPDLAEGGTIGAHAGITGNADLVPDTHGWTDPVAEITVTRAS